MWWSAVLGIITTLLCRQQVADAAVEFKMFAISSTHSSFEDSRNHCALEGGRLAVIEDDITNHLLSNFTLSVGGVFEWIGLKQNDGNYTWIDGSPANMTFLNQLNLTQNDTERCYGLNAANTSLRSCSTSWINFRCSDMKLHICEFNFTKDEGFNCTQLGRYMENLPYQDPKLCVVKSMQKGAPVKSELVQTLPTCNKRVCADPNNSSLYFSCQKECNRFYPKKMYWLSGPEGCPDQQTYKAQSEKPGARVAGLFHAMFSTNPQCVKLYRGGDTTVLHDYCGGNIYPTSNCANRSLCTKKGSMAGLRITCVPYPTIAPEYSATSCSATTATTVTTETHSSTPPSTSALTSMSTARTTTKVTESTTTTDVTETTTTTKATEPETTTPKPTITYANAMEQEKASFEKFDNDLEKCTKTPIPESCDVDNIKVIPQLTQAPSGKPIVAFSTSEVFAIGSEGKKVKVVAAQSKLSNDLLESYLPPNKEENKDKEVPLGSLLHLQVYSNESEKVSAAVSYRIQLTGETVNTASLVKSKKGEKTRLLKASVKCVFLDKKTNRFSEMGMTAISGDTGDYKCQSNHTTVFAVLLSLQSVSIPGGVQILSYITESISVLFLLISLFIFLGVRRKIRGDRPFVQINLTTSLLLLHIFNLVQEAALENTRACEADAVFIHLFLLASAFWMLLEGVTLVTKTMDSAMHLGAASTKVKVIRIAVGWGIPIFIVMVSAAAGLSSNTYMEPNPALLTSSLSSVAKYSKCWLSTTSGVLLGAVVIPVAMAMVLNIIILIRVAKFVFDMSKQTENFKPSSSSGGGDDKMRLENAEHVRATFKAALLLLPVLGIPWVLGFLAGTSVAFMYITVLLNGLQGFFLFLIYVVLSKEVRTLTRARFLRTRIGSKFESSFGTSRYANSSRSPGYSMRSSTEETHFN